MLGIYTKSIESQASFIKYWSQTPYIFYDARSKQKCFFVNIFLSRLSLNKRRKHGRCLISRKLSFISPLLEILSHIKTNVIPLILISHTFKVFLGSILMFWYLFEQKYLTSLTISPIESTSILISFYHLITSIFWWCNLWMITIHSHICYVCYVYLLSSSYVYHLV